MSNKDKEFGEWKSTCVISGNFSIKRFEHGFTFKRWGEKITERIRFDKKTTTADMSNMIKGYYLEQEKLKSKQR